jgi:hypothetical protein
MAEVPNEFDKLATRLFLPNPVASHKVKLAYPTSTKFLRDLPEKHVSIIKNLNWDIPNARAPTVAVIFLWMSSDILSVFTLCFLDFFAYFPALLP